MKKALVYLIGTGEYVIFIWILPVLFASAGNALAEWLLWPSALLGLGNGIFIVIQISKARWTYDLSRWANVDPGTMYKNSQWYLEEKDRSQKPLGRDN